MPTINLFESTKLKAVNTCLKKAETTEELHQRIERYLRDSRKKKKTTSSNFLKRLNLTKLAVLKK